MGGFLALCYMINVIWEGRAISNIFGKQSCDLLNIFIKNLLSMKTIPIPLPAFNPYTEITENGFTVHSIKLFLEEILGHNKSINEIQNWLIGIFFNIPSDNDSTSLFNVEYLYIKNADITALPPIDSLILSLDSSGYNTDVTVIPKIVKHRVPIWVTTSYPFGAGQVIFPPLDNLSVNSIGTDSDMDQITRIAFHKTWAKKVYFSRSNLEFLHSYLNGGSYQDIFFSGCLLNYGYVCNHHSEMERRKSWHNINQDPSQCFSLKAEPITTNLEYFDGEGVISASSLSGNSSNDVIHTPGVIIGAPCPHYWQINNQVTDGILGSYPSDQRRIIMQSPNLQFQLKKIIDLISVNDKIYD